MNVRDSDADLFWQAALVAEYHPDATDCVVEAASELHESRWDVDAPDVSEPPHAR